MFRPSAFLNFAITHPTNDKKMVTLGPSSSAPFTCDVSDIFSHAFGLRMSPLPWDTYILARVHRIFLVTLPWGENPPALPTHLGSSTISWRGAGGMFLFGSSRNLCISRFAWFYKNPEALFFWTIAALIVTIVAVFVSAQIGTIVRNPRSQSEAKVEPTTTSQTNQHKNTTPTNNTQSKQHDPGPTLTSLCKNERWNKLDGSVCGLLGYVSRTVCPSVSWSYTKRTIQNREERQ